MKKLLMFIGIICCLCAASLTSNAQEISLAAINVKNGSDTTINVVTIDKSTYALHDMSKMPWFSDDKTGDMTMRVDTIKVVLYLRQIMSLGRVMHSGNLTWKNGYFVNRPVPLYLDNLRKPITSLFYVQFTSPGFW